MKNGGKGNFSAIFISIMSNIIMILLSSSDKYLLKSSLQDT